ncbi:MAG: hypothetical protein LUI12_04140 [Clostridiales bacterium]|nr:hypothetical protein [Clostridiales bacterium]
MKIGEARTTYNAYYDQLTARYKELKSQAERESSLGNTEQAGVILELSEEVLAKREEVGQFARFDLVELTADMANEILAPEQQEAARKYAQDMAKMMEIARRIASGASVPAEDERKLMEYNDKLYQAVKAAALMAKSDREYDSLWADEEELEHTSMEEIEREIDDTELDMELPEIDRSLLSDAAEASGE